MRILVTGTDCLGKRSMRTMLPMQPGDARVTSADHRLLEALTGYVPHTRGEECVAAFVQWYRQHWARLAPAPA